MSVLKKLKYYLQSYYEMNIKNSTIVSYVPEYIGLEVTNVCNFSCEFCPQNDSNHHSYVPKTYLNEDYCRLYLQKVRDAGIKTNLIHWTLDGEPFMNKCFYKLAWIGVEYNFTNAFFASNGTMCTQDNLLKFPLNKCHITLTIDYCNDEQMFENTRGKKGSWKKIKNNIESILNDKRLNNVNIYLTDISSYIIKDKEELKRRFNLLKNIFPKSKRISYHTRAFHNATGIVKSNRKFDENKKYYLCPYPWTTLRIASNGDVVACCRDLRHKTVLGNLKEDDLFKIWNGENMQNFRKALIDKEPFRNKACAGCDLPYDETKHSLKNYLSAIKGRIQLFGK